MIPKAVGYTLSCLVPFVLATGIAFLSGWKLREIFGLFIVSVIVAYVSYEVGNETRFKASAKYLTIFAITFGLSLWPTLYLAYRLLGIQLF